MPQTCSAVCCKPLGDIEHRNMIVWSDDDNGFPLSSWKMQMALFLLPLKNEELLLVVSAEETQKTRVMAAHKCAM